MSDKTDKIESLERRIEQLESQIKKSFGAAILIALAFSLIF